MKPVAAMIMILMMFGAALGAADLLDYEKRVFRAAEQVERIKTDKSYSDEGVSYIKKLLPQAEQVEIEGRTITADNAWLHGLLDSYSAEDDPQQQIAKLNEAAGRLRALDDHLRKQAEAGPDEAESRERIRQILSRPEYREKGEDQLTALINRIRRTVFEFLSDVYQRVMNSLFGSGSRTGWFVRGAIIFGLIVALAMTLKVIWGRSGRKRVKKQTILGEEIEAGASAADLAEAAVAAARGGDFRTGVRKLYISLLYELAQRNLIEIETHATNRDYLARASRFKPLAAPMRDLTDRFDSIWYGMRPSSEDDFLYYHARYKEAIKSAQTLTPQSI